MKIQSLLALLLFVDHSIIYHSMYQNWHNSDLQVIGIHIKEIFIISKEYRVVSIVTFKSFIDILIFFSFVFYHLNYTNIFYYHTKTILPDNLYDLLQNFDLRRVLIITLIDIYLVSVLIDYFFVKVESNSLDIFSRIGSQIKYGVAIFVFFVIFVVLILLGSLVVGNNVNVVLNCFDSNEFD